MNRFKGFVIVSDFDGTLTGTDGIIPEKNIEAIKYFISRGGRFTVSTGRTYKGFHNYSPEIINAPVLLGNGADAFDYLENKSIFSNAVEADSISVIESIVSAFPQIAVEFFSCDKNSYVLNPNEQSFRHFKGLRIDDYKIADSISESMFPAVKIMLSVNEKTLEVQEFLRTIDLGTIKYIPCTGSYVELLSKNAGKGKALHQISDHLGIPFGNIFAVGDGSNDVDMLSEAVNSFCPSGADALALSVAKEILCSSDDGVIAHLISVIEERFT
ncbi:MAG: HAD-IIB family hydrolase [Clostridia bacterium]|nr:HAD-IIB family hydrolase [Clostridia bacterium]